MEKDANIQINDRALITFQDPVLVAKLKEFEATQPTFEEVWNDPMQQPELIADAIDLLGGMYDEGIIKRASSYKKMAKKYYKAKMTRLCLENLKISDIPCTCCERGPKNNVKQILPVGDNDKTVICYNSCKRTLFAATKRQLKKVFPPEPSICKEFEEYVKKVFHEETEEYLENFDYSFSQWFNHLERGKQQLMENVEKSISEMKNEYPTNQVYHMFCKRELQFEGGKNRAIAGIDDYVQYCIGPVCWALEDIAPKMIKGYCGAANLGELEATLTEMSLKGFSYVLQGDGSGFDLSQHDELKVIDKLVYRKVAEKVWHVPQDTFTALTTKSHKTLQAKYFERKHAHTLMSATIHGTVFSGSSDTTLMNTMRQALYIRYTLERKGLKYGRDFYHKAKGDDFMVFVNNPNLPYQAWFDEVWAKKEKDPRSTDYKPTGLGLILKFLKIGDFDTIDFCSTVAIPIGPHKWKLARMPHRMNPLSHYTMKVDMNESQLKQYLSDLATVMDRHAGDTLFYSSYREAYLYYAALLQSKGKLPEARGNMRKTRPKDGHHERDNGFTPDVRYGKEHAYKSEMLKSSSTASDDQICAFLLGRYGFTRTDVMNHRDFLLHGGLFNPLSDYLAADQ